MGRQHGTMKQLDHGKWLLRVTLGKDPLTGKRITKAQTFAGTTSEARRELTKLLRERDTGTLVAASGQTVASYLRSWLDTKMGLAASTRRAYLDIIERHLIARFGSLKLEAVTASMCQKFFVDLSLKHQLSPRSIRYIYTVFHQALGKAVVHNLLVRNPLDAVEIPKVHQHEVTVWTGDQAKTFLDAVAEDRWYLIWWLLLFTGLRPGEVLGLQWHDFDGTSLTIRRASSRITAGHYALADTKTKKHRRVALDPQTVTLLTAARAQAVAAGDFNLAGLLFATRKATVLDTSRVSRRFQRLILQVNRTITTAGGLVDSDRLLPVIPLYNLRHSHATLLLTKNIHPKIVSERLGHSSTRLTMDTYSHVLPGMQEEAAAKGAQAILG